MRSLAATLLAIGFLMTPAVDAKIQKHKTHRAKKVKTPKAPKARRPRTHHAV